MRRADRLFDVIQTLRAAARPLPAASFHREAFLAVVVAFGRR